MNIRPSSNNNQSTYEQSRIKYIPRRRKPKMDIRLSPRDKNTSEEAHTPENIGKDSKRTLKHIKILPAPSGGTDNTTPVKIIIKPVDKSVDKHDINIKQFIKKCCDTITLDIRVRSTPLYNAYKNWCISNNLTYLTRIIFSKRISKMYEKIRRSEGIFYRGISMLE